jgi:predicted PurR-regulated permease PerM
VIQLVSGAIGRPIAARYAGAALACADASVMMIALFFAYRDGEGFAAQVDRLGERILPARWERISRVVPATISSTVTGMTIIAIGEGLVLGVAY